jgi:hypothetical protein
MSALSSDGERGGCAGVGVGAGSDSGGVGTGTGVGAGIGSDPGGGVGTGVGSGTVVHADNITNVTTNTTASNLLQESINITYRIHHNPTSTFTMRSGYNQVIYDYILVKLYFRTYLERQLRIPIPYIFISIPHSLIDHRVVLRGILLRKHTIGHTTLHYYRR